MPGMVHGIDPPLMTYGNMIVCRQLTWPCANETCQRPECVRAKSMAAHPSSQGPAQNPVKPVGCWACYALSDEDIANLADSCRHCGRKPVKAPTTGVEVLCGSDGRYSITGLSEDDLWTLYGALGYVIANASGDMSDDQRLEKIIGSVLPD